MDIKDKTAAELIQDISDIYQAVYSRYLDTPFENQTVRLGICNAALGLKNAEKELLKILPELTKSENK